MVLGHIDLGRLALELRDVILVLHVAAVAILRFCHDGYAKLNTPVADAVIVSVLPVVMLNCAVDS
jgi:hypothetical protein